MTQKPTTRLNQHLRKAAGATGFRTGASSRGANLKTYPGANSVLIVALIMALIMVLRGYQRLIMIDSCEWLIGADSDLINWLVQVGFNDES